MGSFEDSVGRLRAAAEPTRLRILALLSAGEFNVKDLTQLLGQSQPRVSRHIRLLAEAGLIERHQEGSWVFVRGTSDQAIQEFMKSALAMISENDGQLARDAERAAQIRLARAATAQTYFDQNAAGWDRIRSLHVAEQDVEGAILASLGPGPYDLILDLGTGTGRVLELAHGLARRLVGIDSNREMLKCARVRLDRAGLTNCSVRLGDIYNLPFADHSAGAVIIHQVLHFLDNPRLALSEAARVLQPEGRLTVIDFAPHQLEFLRENHAHMRLGFAPAEIEAWFSQCGVEAQAYSELPARGVEENALTVAIWAGQKPKTIAKQWRAAS